MGYFAAQGFFFAAQGFFAAHGFAFFAADDFVFVAHGFIFAAQGFFAAQGLQGLAAAYAPGALKARETKLADTKDLMIDFDSVFITLLSCK